MTRRTVGVFNGNWKAGARREVNEMVEASHKRIKDANIDKFTAIRDELKDADPTGWEAWYDQDENVPSFILWTDSEMINRICDGMLRRISEVKRKVPQL